MQYIDEIVEDQEEPVAAQRQVSTLQIVLLTVRVQVVGQVQLSAANVSDPVTQAAQLIDEASQLQFVDEMVDIPVLPQTQVRLQTVGTL